MRYIWALLVLFAFFLVSCNKAAVEEPCSGFDNAWETAKCYENKAILETDPLVCNHISGEVSSYSPGSRIYSRDACKAFVEYESARVSKNRQLCELIPRGVAFFYESADDIKIASSDDLRIKCVDVVITT